MLKPNAARALLCALALSMPAVAAIPQEVSIRVGGAEQLWEYHYSVFEGSMISLQVRAQPGDLIGLFAVEVPILGEPPKGDVMTLLLDQTRDGRLSGDFKIPEGAEGKTFQLVAYALSMDGKLSQSTEVFLTGKKAVNDPTDPTDPIFPAPAADLSKDAEPAADGE